MEQADITSFFPKNENQKRLLSDQSNNGDEPKKQREETLEDLNLSDADVFTIESLQSPQVVGILLNVLKNLEKQVKVNHELLAATNSSQIKGEEQLNDVLKNVKYINEKFDDFEKYKEEKEQQVKNLQNQVSAMSKKIDEITKTADKQEQYSRRNCLLIHGIEEKQDESTDDTVIKVFKDNLGVDVNINEIDRSHRLGKPNENANKHRPIIVKFIGYNMRSKVFNKKKLLKGKNMSITESLTPLRMEMLKKAREEYTIQNVWTSDGKIMFKDTTDNKVKIYYN